MMRHQQGVVGMPDAALSQLDSSCQPFCWCNALSEDRTPAKLEQTWYSFLAIGGDLVTRSRSWPRRWPYMASERRQIVPRADTFLWYTNQEGGNPQIGTGLGTGRRNARHAGEPEPRHDHRA